MPAKLDIYNDALAHLGERPLAAGEARDASRALDAQWPLAVAFCLEQQPWGFATRTQSLAPTSGASPNRYANAFQKPGDWIRTADLATDAAMQNALTDFVDEGAFWYANAAQIVVRYVSSDTGWGGDSTRWPASFAEFVAARLAERVCGRIKGLDIKPGTETIAGLTALRMQLGQDAVDAEAAKAVRVFPDTEQAGETRLQVYNDALSYLGRARLSALTDARADIRDLTDQWRSAVRWCLAQAPWQFAARIQSLAPSGDPVPRNGFANAFAKPADWITSLDLAQDAALTLPLAAYTEGGRHWFTDAPGLTARYVSADPSFGLDPTRWPPAFADLLALRLAEKVAPRFGIKAEVVEGLVKLRATAAGTAATIEATARARVFPTTPATLTRLQVYNDALERLGLERIAALTETTAPVRTLNERFAAAARWVLERARWQFAARTVTLGADPAPAVAGFPVSVAKPADWLLTLDLAADAGLTTPLDGYADEARAWGVPAGPVTVRYVSSDAAYGQDAARWPEAFAETVALRLAVVCGPALGAAPDRIEPLRQAAETALARAQEGEAATSARVFALAGAEAVRVAVYNAAMEHLGRPRIAARVEARIETRALNDRWAEAVRWCLEQGPWTFATRAAMIGPYGETVPTFGFANAFKKPDDWLQTVLVSGDEKFRAGLIAYADETGWWFADLPGLFVQYVSGAPSYGLALERWPASFRDLVGLRLAELVSGRIAPDRQAGLVALRADAMKRQRATDALNTPPRFPPPSGWARARRGSVGPYQGDGGPQPPFTTDSSLSIDADTPISTDVVPRVSG